MNTPKLTIGRGFKQQLTKAGVKAEAHFDSIVNAYLATIGKRPGRFSYDWTVETIVGSLNIGSRGHWIVCKFDRPDLAMAIGYLEWLNGYSGKWNHHYEIGAAEPELEHFKRQLGPLLKGKEK